MKLITQGSPPRTTLIPVSPDGQVVRDGIRRVGDRFSLISRSDPSAFEEEKQSPNDVSESDSGQRIIPNLVSPVLVRVLSKRAISPEKPNRRNPVTAQVVVVVHADRVSTRPQRTTCDAIRGDQVSVSVD